MAEEESGESGRRLPSLSTLILLALLLGLGFGLFFGESMAVLKGIADAFIGLLQMAVLPYLVVSLIAGLGSLSYAQAIRLARVGGLLLLLLWGLCLTVVFSLPLTFPEWQSATRFSSALLQPPADFDFVGLYVPHNPFRSLADNTVPAVVLFCVALGVALIGVPDRHVLVQNLSVLSKALGRISTFVVYLTPIGVFAIAASVSGTMTLDEFDRLYVYMLGYALAALLVGLWILPGLLTALAPLRYREVLSLSRAAMLTAFSTGSLFVVLPLISEIAKQMLRSHPCDSDESMIDVLVPVSFNFPHCGNLFALIFVLFAAWFAGDPLGLAEYPGLAVTGIASLFASTTVALPFLLDLFRIPSDLTELFLATGVIMRRFATLVAAMHVLVLTVLGTVAVSGKLQIEWGRVARYLAVSAGLLAALLVGLRVVLALSVDLSAGRSDLLVSRGLSLPPVEASFRDEVPTDFTPRPVEGSRIDRLRERGVLRVGYAVDRVNMPFAFRNEAGELVGFDVDMAHQLARDLELELEFVPARWLRIDDHLAADHFDIAMTGLLIGADSAQRVAFSSPYMELTVAFLVRDHLRDEFASWEAVRRHADELRIGIGGGGGYYFEKVRDRLEGVELVGWTRIEDFVEGRSDLDAMILSAESAAAWTLLHPELAVVVPQPDPFRAPVAYAMPRGDRELVDLVSEWIELKRLDGSIDALYRYWILAEDDGHRAPRWSVLRDVLGWVD